MVDSLVAISTSECVVVVLVIVSSLLFILVETSSSNLSVLSVIVYILLSLEVITGFSVISSCSPINFESVVDVSVTSSVNVDSVLNDGPRVVRCFASSNNVVESGSEGLISLLIVSVLSASYSFKKCSVVIPVSCVLKGALKVTSS